MGSSAVADREAMLAALAQIETLTAQMNRLSIDAFTDVELLDVQQRLEAIARAQPVLDHRVYQRITSQSSPISLGAKNYSAVLSQRLRISQPRVSVHLSCLADCGYVTARRDGKKLRYSVGDPRVADLVMLARSLAADNAAALTCCTRIDTARVNGAGH